MPVQDFVRGMYKWKQGLPKEPEKWAFGGLERTSDGGFPDAGLVGLLQTGTENIAGRPLHVSTSHPITYIPSSSPF